MEDNKPSRSVQRTKYKFVRRAAHFQTASDDEVKLLIYAQIKGIYFRQINESYSRENRRQYYYSKGKHVNCLTHLDTVLVDDSHYTTLIKRSRMLKHVRFWLKRKYSLDLASRCIKRLPNSIETIVISGVSINVSMLESQRFYRSLSTCRKVQFITNDIEYDSNHNDIPVRHEYDWINHYCRRLGQLRGLSYCESDKGLEFQKFVNQARICPYVTSFSTEWNDEHFVEDDYIETDLDRVDKEETIIIPSLFRFSLFPNIRQLNLKIISEHIFSQGSLIQEFKALQKLERLSLVMGKEVKCASILFESLLHLPSLVHFELSMCHINGDDQQLLRNFIHKQTQLVWLTLKFEGVLSSEKQFEEYQHSLESICQSLNTKDRLKFLDLGINVWSLESLSRGLSQARTVNQLEELTIRAFDNILAPSPNPKSKVEGLCEFIKRQKLTLRRLSITIDCVKEDEIVDSLINAIAEVGKLQSFGLTVNRNAFHFLKSHKLFEGISEKCLRGYPLYTKIPHRLEHTLKRLSELEFLTLNLRPAMFSDDLPYINSSVILNALPAMKNLRMLTLRLPCLKESIITHPAQASLLSESKKLAITFLRSCYGNVVTEYRERIEEVDKVLNQTQLQRFIASNLAFHSLCLITS